MENQVSIRYSDNLVPNVPGSPLTRHEHEDEKRIYCVAKHQPKCLVCYDLPMCNSKSYDGCPHCVEIPLHQLKHSAQFTDCQICHVFYGALRPFVAGTEEKLLNQAVLVASEGLRGVNGCDLMIVPRKSETTTRESHILEYNDDEQSEFREKRLYSAQLFINQERYSQWFRTYLESRRSIPKTPGSVGSQLMVRDWVTDCLQTHGFCKQKFANRTDFAPDRLIQIVSPDRIRLSTHHPATVNYIALSYCWGEPRIFSTTNANLSKHLDDVPWPMVPQTFRQAIKITYMLGYRYIWIDSLCIIQDSADDFVVQCKSMGEIYTNAIVVISADAGQSVHTGFLQLRDHASVVINIPPWKRRQYEQIDRKMDLSPDEDPFNLERITNDIRERVFDDVDQVFARPHIMGIDLNHQSDDHDSFYSNPISERGWCFQEERLASRIIHFTKNEMYWECGSHSTCECGKLSWTDAGSKPVLLSRYMNPPKSLGIGTMDAAVGPSEIDFWWSMVEAFSGRKFTRITDRLPALSGLAKTMQCPKLGNYYAGLWEGSLPTSLLWETDILAADHNQRVVLKTYIGPSWSWVSITGQIKRPHPLPNRTVLAKIVSIKYHQSTSDMFGEILPSSINLTGLVKSDILQPDIVRYSDGTTRQSVKLRSEEKVSKYKFLDLPVNEVPGKSPTPHIGEVACLIISRNGEENFWEGLILVKSAKQGGAFERIGVLHMSGEMGKGWRRETLTIV
ncbi:heterokaryon incompatibility protein-domain-containing protein [Xylaria sp. FL1042]|nr:heterokaryon incompatibility protein-domain-containing protein [Xylaria sp. FL1042]